MPQTEDQIFLLVEGESTGPYRRKEVLQRLREGEIDPSTLWAVPGGFEWRTVQELAERSGNIWRVAGVTVISAGICIAIIAVATLIWLERQDTPAVAPPRQVAQSTAPTYEFLTFDSRILGNGFRDGVEQFYRINGYRVYGTSDLLGTMSRLGWQRDENVGASIVFRRAIGSGLRTQVIQDTKSRYE